MQVPKLLPHWLSLNVRYSLWIEGNSLYSYSLIPSQRSRVVQVISEAKKISESPMASKVYVSVAPLMSMADNVAAAASLRMLWLENLRTGSNGASCKLVESCLLTSLLRMQSCPSHQILALKAWRKLLLLLILHHLLICRFLWVFTFDVNGRQCCCGFLSHVQGYN